MADRAIFSLGAIHQAANAILEARPDSIVTWRLLHEVLRLRSDDPELARAKNAAYTSKWVRQLQQAQLPDGSWGRFHTQDTRQKTTFRTTEEAIDRAFALGLEPDDDPLRRAGQYILEVLNGNAKISDRHEKHEAWPLGIKFILFGRLAQLDLANAAIDRPWDYLSEVARRAFSSGSYHREDEVAAYLHLSGIHWPQGFLESQHALRILATRKLTDQLEHNLLTWIWHKADGIGYLRAPLYEFSPRKVGYWLRSMDILSRFETWHEICVDTLNQLWLLRDEHELWDFSSHISKTIDFPLSETWRRENSRRQDFSTCILILLRKYFD